MSYTENPPFGLSAPYEDEETRYHLEKRNTVNLMQMTKKQEEEFKEFISKSKGKARILVHPFFMFPRIPKHYNDGTRTTDYINGIFMVIKKRTEHSIPLLIMEEMKRINTTADFIESFPTGNKPVYFIPTQPATPSPFNLSGQLDYTQPHPYWQPMVTQLKKAGVNHLIVGGAYLKTNMDSNISMLREQKPIIDQMIKKGATQNNVTLLNCAGATASILAHYFKIDISALIFPDNLLSVYQDFGIVPK